MKTTDEIIASWETEGQFTEWYAIDSYDPMSGTMHRLFVGDYDEAWTMMADHYARPTDLAMQPFHRCSLIPSEDALAYFSDNADELPDERGMYDVNEAAGMLGISRQRVHQLIQDGKLDGRKVGKTWYVYRHSVENRMEQTRRLFEMHELEAFLGDFVGDFDVEAIVDEATVVDYRTGNRYWRDGIDLNEICARHDTTA